MTAAGGTKAVAAKRRVLAFVADYLVIACLVAVITAAAFALGDPAGPPADFAGKLRGHAIGFATLTLPVWLYFTLMEGGKRGATLGKRLQGYRVDGGMFACAKRNLVRFLPWELAHAAIWYVPGRPFLDDMPAVNLIVCTASVGAAVYFLASLFIGRGQTPYDRVAKTSVEDTRATAR
ncbi:RDD family protein [Altererythrobacter sp. ZODW24]|uniref:RDD family protein n=1 Tax=Altererythrobacter sp. ZODW24 TaxID=2185142 RepID=UPI0013B38856|nr:RDD family protein [Altererythrobacter sp. ZODW24]